MKLSRTSIGLAVRAARDAAGLTLKDLAEPAGMTISSLSRSENGERDMAFAEMTAIAAKVGIGIEDFRTLAETFERDGASSIAEGRKELARDLSQLQRLAIEATIEARMTACDARTPGDQRARPPQDQAGGQSNVQGDVLAPPNGSRSAGLTGQPKS